MKKGDNRERHTAAALAGNNAVPVYVRHWLERYIEHGAESSEIHITEREREWTTMDQARFIYDVLDSKYQDTGEHEFPEAARDYIEEYLYRLSEMTEIRVWNDPETAITALSTMLTMTGESDYERPSNIALKIAVRHLTTMRERRHFLREEASEPYNETEADRHYKAAMKAARILADPRTSFKVRNELEDVIGELAMGTKVNIYHPALVERALTVMFETKRKGQARRIKQACKLLLEHLDELPDIGESEKEGSQ
jgi:hypothetical protein